MLFGQSNLTMGRAPSPGRFNPAPAEFDPQYSIAFDGKNRLEMVPKINGNGKQFIFSTWVKIQDATKPFNLLNSHPASSNSDGIVINPTTTKGLGFYLDKSGNSVDDAYLEIRDPIFTDTTSFYHVWVKLDTTRDLAEDRFQCFINGKEQVMAVVNAIEKNYVMGNLFRDGKAMQLGMGWVYTNVVKFNAVPNIQTEIAGIDGGADLTPEHFGYFDEHGKWLPRNLNTSIPSENWVGNSWYISGQDADTDDHFHSVAKWKGNAVRKRVYTHNKVDLLVAMAQEGDTTDIFDSVRGADKGKEVAQAAERIETTNRSLLSFNEDGVTIGPSGYMNNASKNYAAIASTASPESGLFITDFVGADLVAAGGKVTHGLGRTPSMVWVMDVTATNAHQHVWHKSLGNGFKYLWLNQTSGTGTGTFGFESMDENELKVSDAFNLTRTYRMYVFADVPGQTASGIVTAPADVKIQTGFRPACYIAKSTVTGRWSIVFENRAQWLSGGAAGSDYNKDNLLQEDGFIVNVGNSDPHIWFAFADNSPLAKMLDHKNTSGALWQMKNSRGEIPLVKDTPVYSPTRIMPAPGFGHADNRMIEGGRTFVAGWGQSLAYPSIITEGKYYWEINTSSSANTSGAPPCSYGILKHIPYDRTAQAYIALQYPQNDATRLITEGDPTRPVIGPAVAYHVPYGYALDADNKTIAFYRDGVHMLTHDYSAADIPDGILAGLVHGSDGTTVGRLEDGTNGFEYAPPSGFQALKDSVKSPAVSHPKAGFASVVEKGTGGVKQTLNLNSNREWCTWDHDGKQYAFAAEFTVSGGGQAITSRLYRWNNVTEQLDHIGGYPTKGISHAEFFRWGGRMFLVLGNHSLNNAYTVKPVIVEFMPDTETFAQVMELDILGAFSISVAVHKGTPCAAIASMTQPPRTIKLDLTNATYETLFMGTASGGLDCTCWTSSDRLFSAFIQPGASGYIEVYEYLPNGIVVPYQQFPLNDPYSLVGVSLPSADYIYASSGTGYLAALEVDHVNRVVIKIQEDAIPATYGLDTFERYGEHYVVAAVYRTTGMPKGNLGIYHVSRDNGHVQPISYKTADVAVGSHLATFGDKDYLLNVYQSTGNANHLFDIAFTKQSAYPTASSPKYYGSSPAFGTIGGKDFAILSSRTGAATSPQTIVEILPDGTMVDLQTMTTGAVYGSTFFEANGELYAFIPVYHSNTTGHTADSLVYVYDPAQNLFVLSHTVPTVGAINATSFTVGSSSYVAVCSSFGGGSTYTLNSKIFKFNETLKELEELHVLNLNAPGDVEVFVANGETYLAYAEARSNSTYTVPARIFKWVDDVTPPAYVTELSGIATTSITHFEVDGRHYLVNGNYGSLASSSEKLCALHEFDPVLGTTTIVQRLQMANVYDIESVQSGATTKVFFVSLEGGGIVNEQVFAWEFDRVKRRLEAHSTVETLGPRYLKASRGMSQQWLLTVGHGTNSNNAVCTLHRVVDWTGPKFGREIKVGFEPDLITHKSTSLNGDWNFFTKHLGFNQRLASNLTNPVSRQADSFIGLTKEGYVVGANSNQNAAGASYVSTAWRAGPEFGVDVNTYPGSGQAGNEVTVNVGDVPEAIFTKGITVSNNWTSVLPEILTLNKILGLNSTAGPGDEVPGGLCIESVDRDVFVTGSQDSNAWDINDLGDDYLAWAIRSVPGFSKVMKYVGNGLAPGPFVHCGFRPRWILFKNLSAGGHNWYIVDTARDPDGQLTRLLRPDTTNMDFVASGDGVQLTNSGFYTTLYSQSMNTSGHHYLAIAFAGFPEGHSNAT